MCGTTLVQIINPAFQLSSLHPESWAMALWMCESGTFGQVQTSTSIPSAFPWHAVKLPTVFAQKLGGGEYAV